MYLPSGNLSEVESLLTKLQSTLEASSSLKDAAKEGRLGDFGIFPPWQVFETCYTEFDMLKGVLNTTVRIRAALKGPFKKDKAATREAVETRLKQIKSIASARHKQCRSYVADVRKQLSTVSEAATEETLSAMLEQHGSEEEAPPATEDLNALKEEMFGLMGEQVVTRTLGGFLQSGIEACDSYLSLPEELEKVL